MAEVRDAALVLQAHLGDRLLKGATLDASGAVVAEVAPAELREAASVRPLGPRRALRDQRRDRLPADGRGLPGRSHLLAGPSQDLGRAADLHLGRRPVGAVDHAGRAGRPAWAEREFQDLLGDRGRGPPRPAPAGAGRRLARGAAPAAARRALRRPAPSRPRAWRRRMAAPPGRRDDRADRALLPGARGAGLPQGVRGRRGGGGPRLPRVLQPPRDREARRLEAHLQRDPVPGRADLRDLRLRPLDRATCRRSRTRPASRPRCAPATSARSCSSWSASTATCSGSASPATSSASTPC